MFKRMGSFAPANLPDLETETMLILLERIATNPQLLKSLREAL
jgi:hypothetical protein